jgi:hypothetical protein
MPAVAPYIPPRDADLDMWAANFSTLITAAPATYGLTSADATTIAAAVLTWHTDYLLVTSPTTKTATAVQNKNAARVSMLATIRPYAQAISLNAGVSTGAKIALGVNPRTSTPTPITAPTTSPVLTAQSTSTAGTIIRYRDATASPSVKAKPYGVVQVQLYGLASTTPITDPDDLDFQFATTKSPIIVPMAGDAGKTVYFAGRWITKTGLLGPWSSIISYVVAG